VREHEIGMGQERFRSMFLNDTIINRALAFRQDTEKEPQTNNRFTKAKEGIHVVKGVNCETEHRVVIGWRGPDSEDVAGWYYRDLDSDFPDKWFCVSEESLRTSQACYIAMLKDITDKIMVP